MVRSYKNTQNQTQMRAMQNDFDELDSALHAMNAALKRMRKRRSSTIAYIQTLVPPRTVSCPYF